MSAAAALQGGSQRTYCTSSSSCRLHGVSLGLCLAGGRLISGINYDGNCTSTLNSKRSDKHKNTSSIRLGQSLHQHKGIQAILLLLLLVDCRSNHIPFPHVLPPGFPVMQISPTVQESVLHNTKVRAVAALLPHYTQLKRVVSLSRNTTQSSSPF